ncbi:MAG: S-layer homology domain-containing protein [Firmicutes bacterium]|nr:S-layer homology domain-containing protein [Bacillota bacterium]
MPSWASAAISGLVRSDIVSGYGDGTIRPLNSVNRAEAAQMLYKLIY